jgi:hypothetical protein
MYLALVLVAAMGAAPELAKMPIPDAAELARAERLIDDVFGDKIKAAKSAEAKAAVAAETLSAIAKETDRANKYVGLQAAKRLGLEAVRQLVASFDSPEAKSRDEWLTTADKAWEAAEQAKGADKLAGRLAAAEAWLRARVEPAGLLALKWKARLAAIEDAGDAPRPELPLQSPPSKTLRLLRTLQGHRVIIINQKSGLGIHVSEGKKNPGAHMVQSDHSRESTNAQWIVEVVNGRWCRFRNVTSGLWLSVGDSTRPDIAKVAKQTPLQDRQNDWDVQWVDDQSVILRHRVTGLCLGPWEGWTSRGTGVHLYPFNAEHSHLQWHFAIIR